MRHRKKGRKLSRTASHKKATMRNMATSLFRHERIETTTAKAKELRPYAERLITLARRGDLHARRLAATKIQDREVLGKLFGDIAPRFAERPGGYTRIIKLGPRRGDGASMCVIEFVDAELSPVSDDADGGAADEPTPAAEPKAAAEATAADTQQDAEESSTDDGDDAEKKA